MFYLVFIRIMYSAQKPELSFNILKGGRLFLFLHSIHFFKILNYWVSTNMQMYETIF